MLVKEDGVVPAIGWCTEWTSGTIVSLHQHGQRDAIVCGRRRFNRCPPCRCTRIFLDFSANAYDTSSSVVLRTIPRRRYENRRIVWRPADGKPLIARVRWRTRREAVGCSLQRTFELDPHAGLASRVTGRLPCHRVDRPAQSMQVAIHQWLALPLVSTDSRTQSVRPAKVPFGKTWQSAGETISLCEPDNTHMLCGPMSMSVVPPLIGASAS